MSESDVCLPEGSCWVEVGGPMPWFSVSVVIVGDTLEPDAITDLLGVHPDKSWRKGAPHGSNGRVRRMGAWMIEVKPDQLPGASAEGAIGHLLARLCVPPAVWRSACLGLQAQMSVGLSLDTFNRGLSIEPEMLLHLGDMGLALDLDIYRTSSASGDDKE